MIINPSPFIENTNILNDFFISFSFNKGLLDKNGNVYNPSSIIVRIGENFDKELEDVSLEYLVK